MYTLVGVVCFCKVKVRICPDKFKARVRKRTLYLPYRVNTLALYLVDTLVCAALTFLEKGNIKITEF